MEVSEPTAAAEELETMEQMAATIAHEIKNPVALALAALEMMNTLDEEHKLQKYAGIVRKELTKINGYAMDLTELAREEAPAPFCLTALLRELAEEDQPASQSMTLAFAKGEGEIWLLGSKRKTALLFQNLIKNALESGGDTVTVSAGADEGWARVTVRDNGPGLPAPWEVVSRNGYTSKAGGSGIGLGICRRVAEGAGGTIEVENGADGGCEAVVTLPVLETGD